MAAAIALLAGLISLGSTGSARAQDWPAHVIRMVAPFAPGGGSDAIARAVAEQLGEQLPQQVVVENRSGASGLIGSAAVASSPPDGYTYVVSSIGTHVIAPAITNAGYDPIRSFAHVAFAGGPPIVMVVHPSLGARTFAEFLQLVRRRSEPLPYVSPGSGTIGNLIAEYWAETEGLKISHVTYRGAGQAVTDLVAGHVSMGCITWTAAIGQIRSGALVPLAVSASERMPGFPDVPTLKELGYADLAVNAWFGFAAPAGVPAAIVTRMNREIDIALDHRSVRKHLDAQGFEVAKMSPAELTAFIVEQIAKWGPLARRLANPK